MLETESGKPIARRLLPGHKTPPDVDTDAFKRVDGLAVDGHKNWWKIYDFSTVNIVDSGSRLKLSVVAKTPVGENHFEKPTYLNGSWGMAIRLVTEVKRDKDNLIIEYFVMGLGWLDMASALEMTCRGEIDNARPVFS